MDRERFGVSRGVGPGKGQPALGLFVAAGDDLPELVRWRRCPQQQPGRAQLDLVEHPVRHPATVDARGGPTADGRPASCTDQGRWLKICDDTV